MGRRWNTAWLLKTDFSISNFMNSVWSASSISSIRKTLVPLKVLIIALVNVSDVSNCGRKQEKDLFLKAKNLPWHGQGGTDVSSGKQKTET